MVNTTGALQIPLEYALYLPDGRVWLYVNLDYDQTPYNKFSGRWSQTGITIPIDLVTAARLRLIRPGDDSGLTNEQWAWIRLIGLTGEST